MANTGSGSSPTLGSCRLDAGRRLEARGSLAFGCLPASWCPFCSQHVRQCCACEDETSYKSRVTLAPGRRNAIFKAWSHAPPTTLAGHWVGELCHRDLEIFVPAADAPCAPVTRLQLPPGRGPAATPAVVATVNAGRCLNQTNFKAPPKI